MKKFLLILTALILAVLGVGAYVHYDDLSAFFGKKEHEHNLVFLEEVAPTCTEDGKKVYTCGDCGETTEETIPATGHTYELTEDVAPTCTEDGKKVYTCGDCGETTEETIPATGHTEEIVPGTAATCIDKGFTDMVKCSVCKHILAMPEIIPALGHDLDLIVPGYAATCTEDGLTDGKECTRCGIRPILQVKIPATGHDFIDETCVNCGVATVSSLWTLPASAGYTVDGNELTFAGTNELTFATKQQYSSVTLTFNVGETQDVRGAFQIGWGAQSQNTSINDLPFVQFNYDRAVLCLPDGTTYDTSWLTGKSWKLTIDAENNKVILSVDGEVVYNVDTSWWTQAGWGLPGYLILRAESNCALTFELTQINPTV